MAEKVTTMVLKVDLQCSCCYKKIKKILCKFPQIREQVYDEKNNAVMIKVVCCSPEKIRDKLCCKGGKTIKSIEIVEPPKPKEPKKPKEPEKLEKRKEPEKLKEPENHNTFVLVQVGYPPFHPQGPCCGPCSEGYSGGPCYERPPTPPPQLPPQGPCCGPCSEGYSGGPCYERSPLPPPQLPPPPSPQLPPPPLPQLPPPPLPPPPLPQLPPPQLPPPSPPPSLPSRRPCYDGYGYGYGPYGCTCGCGGIRGCYVNTQYFCEENSSGCRIM